MRQLTLATASFDKHGKVTRQAAFLAEMERVVPWRELCTVIDPFYPKPGNGRPPVGWSACCGCTFCSSGSTCLTRQRRKRCMSRCRCAALWAVNSVCS